MVAPTRTAAITTAPSPHVLLRREEAPLQEDLPLAVIARPADLPRVDLLQVDLPQVATTLLRADRPR